MAAVIDHTALALLLAASASVQIVHVGLLETCNIEAASAARDAGEAIARCIGLVVTDSKPAAVQP